jgi:hypothetical protein
MKRFLTLVFFSFFSILPIENIAYKKSINFTNVGEKEKSGEYNGYAELSRWANHQMLYLLPDNPSFGIKDGICKIVPKEGLAFFLTIDPTIKNTVYLHLDLTTYKNIKNKDYPIRYLNIYVSKQLKKTVYFNKGLVTKNPTVLLLDPTDFSNGKIEVVLEADATQNGKFWGIWDAFYTFKIDPELP